KSKRRGKVHALCYAVKPPLAFPTVSRSLVCDGFRRPGETKAHGCANAVHEDGDRRIERADNHRDATCPPKPVARASVPAAKRRRSWSADERRRRIYRPVKWRNRRCSRK